jgi:CHAD domain-containing protein
MGFEFKFDESIEKSVRRIVRVEIDHVIADLTIKTRVSHVRVVHESRKRLKKLRALLRLLYKAMSRKLLRRANRTLGDVGRALSASRDEAVLVDALDGLLEHFDDHVSAKSFHDVRALLLGRRRAAAREARGGSVAVVVRSLRVIKKDLCAEPVKHADFRALRQGLKRTFRRGRDAYDIARSDRDPARLHAWRKRSKDLWHQAQLLEPIWPDVLQQFGEKIHALADCLGEDHDLVLLQKAMVDQIEESDPTPSSRLDAPTALETLLGLIDLRRRELQQAAMQLGERIYSEAPAAFIERMENYWNAWRSGETAVEEAG